VGVADRWKCGSCPKSESNRRRSAGKRTCRLARCPSSSSAPLPPEAPTGRIRRFVARARRVSCSDGSAGRLGRSVAQLPIAAVGNRCRVSIDLVGIWWSEFETPVNEFVETMGEYAGGEDEEFRSGWVGSANQQLTASAPKVPCRAHAYCAVPGESNGRQNRSDGGRFTQRSGSAVDGRTAVYDQARSAGRQTGRTVRPHGPNGRQPLFELFAELTGACIFGVPELRR